jgi:hypothetical protein
MVFVRKDKENTADSPPKPRNLKVRILTNPSYIVSPMKSIFVYVTALSYLLKQ